MNAILKKKTKNISPKCLGVYGGLGYCGWNRWNQRLMEEKNGIPGLYVYNNENLGENTDLSPLNNVSCSFSLG